MRPQTDNYQASDFDGWRLLAAQADVVGLYVDSLEAFGAESTLYYRPVAIEVGGLLDYALLPEFDGYGPVGALGERSANIETEKLERLGRDPEYLRVDQPIYRAIKGGAPSAHPPNLNLRAAGDELAVYLRIVHERFPDTAVGLITPLLNWGWRGEPAYWGPGRTPADYNRVQTHELRAFEAARLPLAFLHIDAPYDYMINAQSTVTGWEPEPLPDWFDVLYDCRLLTEMRAPGTRFGIIFNSQRGGEAEDEGEQLAVDTLDYITAVAERGIDYDDVIVQSWHTQPKALEQFVRLAATSSHAARQANGWPA
jgi:hypothetical protein